LHPDMFAPVADNGMQGGVFDDAAAKDKKINHFVAIVGWGEDDAGTPYWTVRNRYTSFFSFVLLWKACPLSFTLRNFLALLSPLSTKPPLK